MLKSVRIQQYLFEQITDIIGKNDIYEYLEPEMRDFDFTASHKIEIFMRLLTKDVKIEFIRKEHDCYLVRILIELPDISIPITLFTDINL